MFSIMKQHSSRLRSSLEPKVQNEEVITMKEWVDRAVPEDTLEHAQSKPSPRIIAIKGPVWTVDYCRNMVVQYPHLLTQGPAKKH